MGRKPSKPWAKLDFDWFEDPRVMSLQAQHGSKAVLCWAKLIGIWADFEDARIDAGDPGVWILLKRKLDLGDKALRSYFDALAEIGLIVPEMWRDLGIVTNRRAADDARKRQAQRAGGSRGGSAGA